MRERLKRRFADGASAVEYGLLIALIAAVITATIGGVGQQCDQLVHDHVVADV